MKFTKMHGAGNDYLYVNCFEAVDLGDIPSLAQAMSDRHFGAGGDGLVLIQPSERADARMRMFNADGSEAEMCGNAVRCVAKYVYDHGIAKKEELAIETGRGVLTLQCSVLDRKVDRVRVNMAEPILKSSDIPTTLPGDPPVNAKLSVGGRDLEVTCVSMGNPHCVTFVDEVNDDWVLNIGPRIEVHEAFPRKINAEFIQVLSPSEVIMRVWERGSGETLACGTGACGAVVAGVLAGKNDRNVTVHLTGGDLEIEWAETGEVYMTGPAAEIFTGEWHA
ncbi:MAG: diaminopimelate epimerase [Planctomycetota bacterium]|nr:diaminopimelate epimerase [Planctomycetota bacterium]MDA1247633.1 diaminopimelate epimerase [Planctomycetota bacterium]